MNSQLVKTIRKFVDIKIKEEHLPQQDRKKLYRIFKGTYEEASPKDKLKYQQEMEQKIKSVSLKQN